VASRVVDTNCRGKTDERLFGNRRDLARGLESVCSDSDGDRASCWNASRQTKTVSRSQVLSIIGDGPQPGNDLFDNGPFVSPAGAAATTRRAQRSLLSGALRARVIGHDSGAFWNLNSVGCRNQT